LADILSDLLFTRANYVASKIHGLRNHFHFLVRILDADEIDFMKPRADKKKIIYPVKKKYNRTGGLFESPFRRIEITDERYFKQLIYYIHNNPVHHGFCDSKVEYPWSSYLTMLSVKPTKLHRDKVIGWFNTKSEFVRYHRENHESKIIESILIE
jgi:putative transposase